MMLTIFEGVAISDIRDGNNKNKSPWPEITSILEWGVDHITFEITYFFGMNIPESPFTILLFTRVWCNKRKPGIQVYISFFFFLNLQHSSYVAPFGGSWCKHACKFRFRGCASRRWAWDTKARIAGVRWEKHKISGVGVLGCFGLFWINLWFQFGQYFGTPTISGISQHLHIFFTSFDPWPLMFGRSRAFWLILWAQGTPQWETWAA